MASTKGPMGLRVKACGFGLLKDKEKREGRRITFDELSDETGLAKMTVRRYVTDGDVTGSPLVAAVTMAQYFGVGIDDLLVICLVDPVSPIVAVAA